MAKKSSKKKVQEYIFEYNNTSYTIALGGIHSNDKPRAIIPNDNEILRDADIGSQYPSSIIKRKLYPEHLGEEWLIGYKEIMEKRIISKKLYKTTKNKKYKSLDEALKLSLNGGGYGKLGESNSWQYSPENKYKVTIGNQFEILYLIEKLEFNKIHVVSANTDGIVCLFDKLLDKLYYEICSEWEKEVGNDVLGKLEYKDYKALYQTSVNDYLAISTNDEIKKKGDFTTDFEIHKNKSFRVIPLALEQYFVNNINPEVFIKSHNNIFDFCGGVKSKGDNKIILFDKKTGEEQILQKINRYYISKNGNNLIKRMPPLPNKKASNQLDIFGNIDTGIRESEVEAGYLSIVYNKHSDKKIEEYNIDYDFYINKCQKIIDKIMKKENE